LTSALFSRGDEVAMNDAVQLVMATPIGSALSAAEVTELVQAAATRSVSAGATLFEVGDQGDALFIILQGSAKVVLGKASTGVTDVATLGPGQIVGELEVMTRSLRVASVIATEDTTTLELTGAKLDAMLDENRAAAGKLVLYVARTLARRLAAVNQRIVAKEPPPPADSGEPMEISDEDVIPIDDDDLDVLDKLWS